MVLRWLRITLGAVLVLGTLAAGSAAGVPRTPVTGWPLDVRHLRAADVWRLSRGAGVVVAVVDSGVDAGHRGLAGQVLAGVDLTGADGDGRVDTSPDSHGTAIAGIIAGVGVGLAPAAKILPIRVTAQGAMESRTIAAGIRFATAHGSQIIDLSFGSRADDPLVHAAVADALDHDVLVVAAAGNQGDQDNALLYPAAIPGVLAVAGLQADGTVWPGSEHGEQVSLAAPATRIVTTDDRGSYTTVTGTSFAAPYVSAAAALLRARYPALTASQVAERLEDTADRAAGGKGKTAELGYGAVDPLRALSGTGVPTARAAGRKGGVPLPAAQDAPVASAGPVDQPGRPSPAPRRIPGPPGS